MKTRFNDWVDSNITLLANAGSLIGTTVVTSGLGFVYWWLAARSFSSEAVGFASAMISAMMLLGNLGMLGLGTLLIGELPRRHGEAGHWIATSLLVAGGVSGVLGVSFAFLASRLSMEFVSLAQSLLSVALFTFGVVLTAMTLVIDQALIGLFRGELQFWRNTFFAIGKLIVLLFVGIVLVPDNGLAIYATWAIGNLISLAILAGILVWRGERIVFRPHWTLIRHLGVPALSHHALNLALQFPSLMLPLVVTVGLSAELNASFYVAWMISSFVFVVPISLTTVLYAVGVSDLSLLERRTRFTLHLSLAAGLVAVVGLFIGAGHLLRLFGASYASDAEWSLRILALGVFPLIIKVHYVALRRISDHIRNTAIAIMVAGLFEVGLAAVGASLDGLSGLSIGWLVAVSVESIVMMPYVNKIAAWLHGSEIGLGLE